MYKTTQRDEFGVPSDEAAMAVIPKANNYSNNFSFGTEAASYETMRTDYAPIHTDERRTGADKTAVLKSSVFRKNAQDAEQMRNAKSTYDDAYVQYESQKRQPANKQLSSAPQTSTFSISGDYKVPISSESRSNFVKHHSSPPQPFTKDTMAHNFSFGNYNDIYIHDRWQDVTVHHHNWRCIC